MTERLQIDPVLQETIDKLKNSFGLELDSITVDRAVLGLFFSGLKLSCGTAGLCFTPLKEIPEAVCCPSSAAAMPKSGRLTGVPVEYYLEELASPHPLRRMLGICAINALSNYYWKKFGHEGYDFEPGVNAFDAVQIPPPGKKTVVIGALVPMLKRLLQEKADFTVLEMVKGTLKGEELKHYAPAEAAPQYVPEADLLVITGVTIFNHTITPLLEMAKKDAIIVIAGPTASMLPDAFFRRNVSVMGGLIVTEPDATLDLLAEGGSGYHLFGKTAERLVIKRS
ncbi:MAG: DUF364 domain-containing protein [Burkholderiales bacterium]|nr:DUF364 domain-containing protein [Burkholderiales bacterium]